MTPSPSDSGIPAIEPAANAARLYRYLGASTVLLAGVFLLLTYLGTAPILPADDATPLIGYGFSGIALALMAVALFVLRPRVPRCPPGQSEEEFWARPGIPGQVLLVWLLLESSGTIAAVGFLITGQPATAVMTILALGAYWFCGPSLFAKA